MAEKEAINSQNIIESEGNKIVELTEEEHATFVKSVASLHKEARGKFGNTMFEMLAN